MPSKSKTPVDPAASARTTERLAIEGGPPVRVKPLPPASGVALIGEEEKRAVLEVLEGGSLFRYYGPRLLGKVAAFERALALEFGLPHALAVSSGTAALRVTLSALGIGPGAEVIVPACSFVGCAGAVIACGAIPVFAECDRTLTLDPQAIEEVVSPATRAIIVVHFKGILGRMPEIKRIAGDRGLFLVEDGAQAFGAAYLGKRLGAWGTAATLSFQLNKLISAGEGGAVLTSDPVLHARATMIHDQGWLRQTDLETPPESVTGENYRLSELAGAVLSVQLGKVPVMVNNLREHQRVLRAAVARFGGLRVRESTDPEGEEGSALVLYLPDAEAARFFRRALRTETIECENLWKYLAYAHRAILEQRLPASPGCSFECPRASRRVEYRLGLCPRTEELLARAVSIPISPALTEEDRADILTAIRKVWSHMPRR